MSALNVLSLFSGIGGLELGLERAGMTVVGQVEIDPFCRRVLAEHWPEVPRHDDVRTCVEWWRSEPRPAVHLVAGGFPCQPASSAGLGLAQDDDRWLWPDMARVVRRLRPRYVLVENVAGLLDRGFGDVLGDLAGLGFDAEWGALSACAMGAPHPRERVLVVAYPEGESWWPAASRPMGEISATAGTGRPRVGLPEPGDSGWWDTEPRLGRVADGLPARLDRRTALGNAVVPQVAQRVGELILAADQGAAA
jgi:DNA (cytosine-5)-methyltransferase 1